MKMGRYEGRRKRREGCRGRRGHKRRGDEREGMKRKEEEAEEGEMTVWGVKDDAEEDTGDMGPRRRKKVGETMRKRKGEVG